MPPTRWYHIKNSKAENPPRADNALVRRKDQTKTVGHCVYINRMATGTLEGDEVKLLISRNEVQEDLSRLRFVSHKT